MRRIGLITSALAGVVLAACTPASPPTATNSAESTTTDVPTQTACNTVTPDPQKLVQLGEQAQAAVGSGGDLAGGRIAPGVYDLVSGFVSDGALAWAAPKAAALEIVESAGAVTFNYATSEVLAQRWNGAFHEGPPAGLDYTCGLTGHVDLSFAAQARQLRLRVPDSTGHGYQTLIFERRA